jgi:hypothetical protein
VDHSSDGHDDIVVPVATRNHNSDGHDGIIYPSLLCFSYFNELVKLYKCYQMENIIYYPLN